MQLEEENAPDELSVSKFKDIFFSVVHAPLTESLFAKLLECICDKTLNFIQFDHFYRLCDLFFFIPGAVYKDKNDSENMYLIMSSMARKKASILTK